MGIFKDTFSPFVHDQLYIRQSLAAFGNMEYGKKLFNEDGTLLDIGNQDMNLIIGTKWGSRMDEYGIPIGTVVEGNDADRVWNQNNAKDNYVGFRTKEEFERLVKLRGRTIPVEYWHSWMLNKSCTLRMSSMVDLVDEDILDLDYEFNGVVLEKELMGYGLARNYMLEGGTLLNVDGMGPDTDKYPMKRDGFPNKGKLLGTAYGDPLARGDGRLDEYGESYGIVPMPGIVKANIRTKSAYGSIKEAKIEFVCHNLRQLSVMELLYMRPGYPVLLEWGWSPYINNGEDNGQPELITDFNYISDKDRFWGRAGTGKTTMQQQEITDLLCDLKRKSCGNHDGLLGLVKNFSYTARNDGGFNCVTELMGAGEIISSLKSNGTTLVVKDPKDQQTYYHTMTELQDFITSTYDYLLGEREDELMEEDKAITKQGPGDDGEYGTDDDPEEVRGERAHYSERHLNQPKVWNPPLLANYKWRKNIEHSEVEKSYKKHFFDTTKFDGENIFDKVYMLTFEDTMQDSSFWANIAITTALYSRFGPWGAAAGLVKGIWDAIVESGYAKSMSEGYIRLDALLYMINKNMIPPAPKTKKTGGKIVSYQTLHYNAHAADDEKYRMHTFSYKYKEIKPLFEALWRDADEESPQGKKGEYIDQSASTPREIIEGSIDPYVCMFPHQYKNKYGSTDEDSKVTTFFPEFLKPVRNYVGFNSADFKKKSNGGIFDDCFNTSDYSKQKKLYFEGLSSIGHIMINVEFLIETHFKLWQNDKDYGVGEFLNEVLAGVNKASGGKINLSIVTDNEYSHIANIIDLNKAGTSSYESIFRFNVLSNDSCVKEFSFNTAIPTAMSSTIAVAAMNPDSADNLDQVTFASMNRGISNRLYRNTPPDNKELTEEEKEQLIYDCRLQQHELNMHIVNLMTYHQQVASGEYFSRGNNTYRNKVAENGSRMSRVMALIDILSTKNPDGSIIQNPITPTPIPIKIDITLEGISGMVIGQMFRINESRLPKQYRYKKICFIVISEEQNITTDGQWETKISGQMQLFPDDCKKLENLNNIQSHLNHSTTHVRSSDGGTTGHSGGAENLYTKDKLKTNSAELQGWELNILEESVYITCKYSFSMEIAEIIAGKNDHVGFGGSVQASEVWKNKVEEERQANGYYDKTDADGCPGRGYIEPLKDPVSEQNRQRYQHNTREKSMGSCFLIGSMVLMADGTWKSIETIEIGDLVRTKEETDVPVLRTFKHSPNSEKRIYFNGDNLRVTNKHPLYVNGKWQTADELGWRNELMYVDNVYYLETESNYIVEGIPATGIINKDK